MTSRISSEDYNAIQTPLPYGAYPTSIGSANWKKYVKQEIDFDGYKFYLTYITDEDCFREDGFYNSSAGSPFNIARVMTPGIVKFPKIDDAPKERLISLLEMHCLNAPNEMVKFTKESIESIRHPMLKQIFNELIKKGGYEVTEVNDNQCYCREG
ncbi:hypothetical protein [uncultured Helicobacter sp.]|uniref:hypothetical protein n=1 Tax=uncultured Helicobacter sp. TaxID=175537 RepID=UPI00374FB0ED